MKKLFTTIDLGTIKGQPEFSWQNGNANLLAVSTSDQNVRIYGRRGDLISNFNLPGNCAGLSWDKDGDVLAVIFERGTTVLLWDANSRKHLQVDTGFKDSPTFLSWSKANHQLAVGTLKGNLLLYDYAQQRKIPVLGKHTKRIVSGAWSVDNLLALGSEDKTLSINNSEGDPIKQLSLREVPMQISFSAMKTDESTPRDEYLDNTVCAVLGKRLIFLCNLTDADNPYELAFQDKYGDIVQYEWYGDGYILIGFSQGYMVAISTHMKEIGQEVFQTFNHRDYLSGITVSHSAGKAASCGDNTIRVHKLGDLKETINIVNLENESQLGRLSFSDDGQLIAISTQRGVVHIYLTRLPVIGVSYRSYVAYLSSLLEVSLQDFATVVANENSELNSYLTGANSVETFACPVEPTFIGLGPNNVVVGMNNRAWFYRLTNDSLKGGLAVEYQQPTTREYLGSVQQIKLTSCYAAAMFEGKIQLHNLDGAGDVGGKLFPEKEHKGHRLSCFDLTSDCLVYGSETGLITYYLMEDKANVNEYKHSQPIVQLYCDTIGVKLVFLDRANKCFVYNPVNDHLTEVLELPSKVLGVLWDSSFVDKNVFCVWNDEGAVFTFSYSSDSIRDAKCVKCATTKLPYGSVPLCLWNGSVAMLSPSGGKLQQSHLQSHPDIMMSRLHEFTTEQLVDAFDKFLKLQRFKDAWHVATQLRQKSIWQQLGQSALVHLEIDFAIRVYRHIGDAGMALELNKLKSIEELNLKCGYVAMFVDEHDLAQELFLKSANPKAALELRRDLLNWDTALKLANALAVEQIPFISKEYAQQLEFTGDYAAALQHYKKGVTKDPKFRDHDEACAGGVARMSLRMGDLRTGIELVRSLPSRTLKRDCAQILESMKQWTEAAQLYEIAKYPDKAAAAFIRAKNWTKVGELLPQVSGAKIHMQYAKAREADGRYAEACKAYSTAKAWEHVIRIQLDHLSDPEEAVRIVQETNSIEGARMVAQYFQKKNDYESAVQFLVMSNCNDEALLLALEHHQMEIYAEAIGDNASSKDYHSVAIYFENALNHLQAGRFFMLAQEYGKAISHLLKCKPDTPDEPQAISLAIETVGRSGDNNLTSQVIDHLMGDTDGVPKDPKYLFELYMALKQYPEASKTALIISREEQNNGKYREARNVLFEMMRKLKSEKIRISNEMSNCLMLLHSYLIAKIHVQRQDHLRAARLLIRVSNNISKFPSHVVQLLTSSVISCHRAQLKQSAFSLASMLMRPEYRNQIDAKYKKKIEQIVRRPDKDSGDLEEAKTPCPYCGADLREMELVCESCSSNIPFCVASGKHIVRSDLTVCPKCEFVALYSELTSLLSTQTQCPMCADDLKASELELISDEARLERLLNPDSSTTDSG